MLPGITSSTFGSQNFSYFYSRRVAWGRWGSNPRPADYEKSGPAHHRHYLHGYHEAVPLMAPIALIAPMAWSMSRSTAAAPIPWPCYCT